MLPTLSFESPEQNDWLYEVKYDGFRAILDWDMHGIRLTSRNGKSLLTQFPEIEDFLLARQKQFDPLIPFRLDGELVYLENSLKASFSVIQTRGRLRTRNKIKEQALEQPCLMMVFDLLLLAGTSLTDMPYHVRKEKLKHLFFEIGCQINIHQNTKQFLQYVEAYSNFKELWNKVILHGGEGIVAKQKNSLWMEGKRSNQWLKYKNWKHVSCFFTAYNKGNEYFLVGVYKGETIIGIGQVLAGIKPDEKHALLQILLQNSIQEDERFIYIEPAICLDVLYLDTYKNELREPAFERFRFDLKPHDCSYERFISESKNTAANVEISHPDKLLWVNIKKENFIQYLFEVSPYMLPFLKNRLLTVIRYPHGISGYPFFQKNCPDYAPDFVETFVDQGINYIVCNNLETLIWLGNQLAIEFHIPFQTMNNRGPGEIVFDLDPPSIEDFSLAVKAAIMIKEVLDQLKLISFTKTSGNKGLQVYIPLPDEIYTYDDTRLFTSFIAEYLISREPDSFTIERLKKNRGHRLYVDYVQHSEGKTIVSPYSMRGNQHAGVATPLDWDEVNDKLEGKRFNLQTAIERINKQIDPFKHYFTSKQVQPFQPVLDFLNKGKIKG